MKKAQNCFVSVALTCVILLGMLPMMQTFVNAAAYTSTSMKPDFNNNYYYREAGKIYPWSVGNCTLYAWGRAYELLGTRPNLYTGNAGDWYDYNARTGYYSYSNDITKPAIGAIICWSKPGGEGHVAIVEAINGDMITESDSAWARYDFGVWRHSVYEQNLGLGGYTFQGYIYILGNGTGTNSSPSNNNSIRPYVGYGYTTQGSAVSDLQTMLNKVTGAGLAVDGIFGADTQQAIKNYQSRKGLTADGICGIDTWTALEADYNTATAPTTNQSSSPSDSSNREYVGWGYTTQGKDVSDLQTMLNKVNAAGLVVDGIFGNSTYYAIQAYQSRKGLTADGICGIDTWTALEADYKTALTTSNSSTAPTTPANTASATTGTIDLTGVKSEYKDNESIVFNWAEVPNAATYTLEIQAYQSDGSKGILQTIIDVKSGATKKLNTGTYSARISYKPTKYGESIYGNWVSFKVVPSASGHTHTLAHTAAKSSTETAEGNIEYWYCSSCGKYFSNASATQEISKNQTVLAKLAHKHSLTHTAAKTATEQAIGNIEYWYCSACGKYFSDANATKEISKEQTVVAQLNHTHKLVYFPKKNATCTEGGNIEYWRCSDCSKYFSDAQGKNEISAQSILIAALGHNYVNGVCSRCGEKQTSTIKNKFGDIRLEKQTLYFQGQFNDVPANQWYTDGIASAVEFGLMKGSDNGFNPYGDVTLAEAITMAARINSIYRTGSESFDQSVGNAWYQTYLDYAYQNGIISRAYYNSDISNKATRAQFAEIFARCLPDVALQEGNSVSDNAIPDVGMSDSFAQYVYKLYRAGILTGGDANGTFSPLTYITRAEAATIVSRMADSNNRVSISLN